MGSSMILSKAIMAYRFQPRSSFFRGAGYTFDLGATMAPRTLPLTGPQIDYFAARHDWNLVGHSIANAANHKMPGSVANVDGS